jgi:ketosteroid isomerase-like protein
MTGDDESAVRAANQAFYAALSGLDVERMGHLWLHADWVRCIHPGGDLIEGWDEIEHSWAGIFQSASWLQVVPTGVELTLTGGLAIVVCHENITQKQESHVRVSLAVCTNIFSKIADGWRMVHHHASAAPVTVTQPFSGTVQ